MADAVAFVVILVSFVLSAQSAVNCPQTCVCTRIKDGSLAVSCETARVADIVDNLPPETTKLNFSSNGQLSIKWSNLEQFKNLTELDFTTAQVNCNCNYFKYWKNNIQASSISISGECTEPSKYKGTLLSKVGDKLKDECGGKNGLVKPTLSISKEASTSTDTKGTVSPSQNTPESTPSRVLTPEVLVKKLPTTTAQPTDPTTTTQPTAKTEPTTGTTSATRKGKIMIDSTSQPASEEITTKKMSTTTAAPTTVPKPGPPIINLYLPSTMVKIGSVVEVICQVNGLPRPDINMTVNDQDATKRNGMFSSLANGGKVVFEAKLTSQVTCLASNKFGTRKKTLQVMIQRDTISYFTFDVKMTKEKYTNELTDTSSTKFQNLEKRLNKELTYVYSEFAGFYGATMLSARPGSVIAEVLIKTTNSTLTMAKKLIEESIQAGTLGSIPVNRFEYSFQDKTEVCPGEYLNITWSDMLVGQTAIADCPRGAKGIARRNCTKNGWYYPDYTRCKSDSFSQLQRQMKSVTAVPSSSPSKDVLSILRDIKNVSQAYKDYSHLAGDLNLCIEIIDMLTNYTKHHRNDVALNDIEAQLVVDITSNLIHLNHEQELIISQKLVQKPSVLIRAVEYYGLQASLAVHNGTGDLRVFIADNVVLGVGIVEPLTISTDVTFPNYDLPELDRLRSAWGSSSFIVIDKEIVERQIKVKRFKVCGFLYRTLTRILSAESAYSMVGQGYEINSAVVSITLDPPLPPKLDPPVTIASNNLNEVRLDGDSPICAFWDFELNKPNGGWSDKGCWYTHYNTHNTTCLCEHLTNFAVLKEKPVFFPQPYKSPLVSYPFFFCILIGCIIMICFCAITLIILLIFAWRMKPDRTWGMHMFVCATLITAFALIIVGLYKYDQSPFFCNLLSMLVHYFVLSAITWIMAEATYMSTWANTHGPKKRYWIGYFFLGFVPAAIPMAVTWALEGFGRFKSFVSCWMQLSSSLLWVFFIPAVIFLLITILIFRKIWKTATGNLRVHLKSVYWKTRFRVHVRYCIAIQVLVILTWLCGLLVITYYSIPHLHLAFCILFIIFCVITGFVIIIFYVVTDRQFDDAFRECCCYCCNQGKYEVQKREDLWARQHPERVVQEEAIEPEQAEEEQHEPLIVYVTRKPPASEPSMSSIDDPLYERVKKPNEMEEPITHTEPEEPQEEPVYAKVYKEEESEASEPFPIAQPGSPRFLRGLTRLEVMRMAKKSDASKRELKKFESPKGSTDDVSEHPTYLMNQEELDEELQHFRTFYAESISRQGSRRPSPTTTPPGTPIPGTPGPSFLSPRSYSASSSSSTTQTTKTKRVVKKTTKKSTKKDTTKTQTQESFESSSTITQFTHETSSYTTALEIASDRDTPPAIPPRAPDLLDDEDELENEFEASMQLLDVDRDDESFTDVSAADDIDRDSDGDSSAFLDSGSRPTAV